MSRWNPCPRKVFITRLRALGFIGPLAGAKHQFMLIGEVRLTIPSNNEYSVPQLRMMIKQAESLLGSEIDADLWNSL